MEKRIVNRVMFGCIGLFFVLGMQAGENMDVCLHVDTGKVFRRNDINSKELENFGRFGMKKPLPFDKYFYVESALYTEYLDTKDCVELKRDLKKNIPSMIYSSSLSHKERRQYQFPKFVPQSFIDSVKDAQNSGKPFIHKIYEKNGKDLTLKYEIIDINKQDDYSNDAMNDSIANNGEGSVESILGSYSGSYFGLYALLLAALGSR